ncbi:MAG: hypothetical protein K2I70_02860 [Bacilli bacterium]|nr:hypothetical protein [Bacilli bacterium]
MDQKMMKTLGGIIAGFVVFIFILFMISSCSKTTYTYDKLETKMMDVAKSYFEANKDELPKEDKDTKTLTLKKMISDGKIEELTELFDNDEVKCDGNVTVTNNNGYYIYTPYLNCGKDYESVYLKDKIIENSLVTEESSNPKYGLYEVGDQYIMKGEVDNNYVKFADQLFRVVRINDDGTIRLLQVAGLKQQVWDNRFNPDFNYNGGINEYFYNGLNSRVKDAIENYYNDSAVWNDEAKGYMVKSDLCIGKRSQADVTKDGSTECSKKLNDQVFGLLSVYEIMQASLDTNCNNTVAKSCANYNWLSTSEESIWTATADAENSQYVYVLYKIPTINNASAYANVNVVFNLTDKAIYVDGDGTIEKPYVFK